MINLEPESGMPLTLTDDFHLKFNPPLKPADPVIRNFSEMVPVLFDKLAIPHPRREEMYYMYRDVHLPQDTAIISQNHLRYDITVIPAAMIGKEFNKTIGHYHPAVMGANNFSYPEMYEVLTGKALFLIQKMDLAYEQLISVYGIQASKGDKVIYPPGYGHIIVNIGSEPLVTGNWVSSEFKSLYGPIADHQGMAYYVLVGDEKPFVFLKNEHYSNHPPIRMLNVADQIRTEFGFERDLPMYPIGVKNPKQLEFLNKPEKYAVQLSTLSS